MICLDTNYLILALVPDSRASAQVLEWSAQGELFFVSAVVWFEFICGPVNARQIGTMRTVLNDIVPFDERQAEEAARLFNACGRKRHLRVDAVIAAAATTRGARLATGNAQDFQPFVDSGLKLVS